MYLVCMTLRPRSRSFHHIACSLFGHADLFMLLNLKNMDANVTIEGRIIEKEWLRAFFYNCVNATFL